MPVAATEATLRAIAPRCSLFDVYTDVAFPGGLRQGWFTSAWTRANQALDANHPERMIAEAIAHEVGTAIGFATKVQAEFPIMMIGMNAKFIRPPGR